MVTGGRTISAGLAIGYAAIATLVRPGRTLYVAVHIVLDENFPIERLATLDRRRDALDTAVRRVRPLVFVDTFFTAERCWAEPTAGLHKPGSVASNRGVCPSEHQ